MEQSTKGVVEGRNSLAQPVGRSLKVVMFRANLAELIQGISTSRARLIRQPVAGLMQDILHVTEQTTAGTQRTAQAVDETDRPRI